MELEKKNNNSWIQIKTNEPTQQNLQHTHTYIHIYIHTQIYIDIDIYIQHKNKHNGKVKIVGSGKDAKE